jgi:hypothetical protein
MTPHILFCASPYFLIPAKPKSLPFATMKSVITTILFALLFGVTAAFLKPAAPYQVDTKPALFARGGASTFDAGLDNPEIAEDTNISPSRKCGFCMGVS